MATTIQQAVVATTAADFCPASTVTCEMDAGTTDAETMDAEMAAATAVQPKLIHVHPLPLDMVAIIAIERIVPPSRADILAETASTLALVTTRSSDSVRMVA
jgi:hypothetical protein